MLVDITRFDLVFLGLKVSSHGMGHETVLSLIWVYDQLETCCFAEALQFRTLPPNCFVYKRRSQT